MSTKKRSYSVSNAAKKGRYTIVGYDRSKGGIQGGGLQSFRQMQRVGELKDITVRSVALAPTGTTSVTPLLLNGVAQGTTPSTRLGRRIMMKSLLVRYFYSIEPTTAGNSPLRFLCVYDAQTNAAAPGVTSVVLTDELTSPMNLSNSRRFKVLFDETCNVVGSAGPQAWMFQKYIKLNLATEFNDNSAGTVGDITTGSIYVFVWQNGNLITATGESVMYSRIRFSDS